jgi:hypothetical protein
MSDSWQMVENWQREHRAKPLADIIGLELRSDYGCPHPQSWAQPTERQLSDWIEARGYRVFIAIKGNSSRGVAVHQDRPEICVRGRDGTCFDVLEQLVRHIAGADSEP